MRNALLSTGTRIARLTSPYKTIYRTPGHDFSVEHEHNQSHSREEAAAISKVLATLLDGNHSWVDAMGQRRPLGVTDILVVAPYNAQVSLLKRTLLEGARVGTVDRFQGQEAPLVIYSMTTSTAEDAPRGMEFLYSPNRLNVATSRARSAVFLIGSPKLFEPTCMTPQQMQLANGFCRYRELATLCHLG